MVEFEDYEVNTLEWAIKHEKECLENYKENNKDINHSEQIFNQLNQRIEFLEDFIDKLEEKKEENGELTVAQEDALCKKFFFNNLEEILEKYRRDLENHKDNLKCKYPKYEEIKQIDFEEENKKIERLKETLDFLIGL